MLALAERIDGDTPVAAAGLVRTRLLLADRCGPLYNRRRADRRSHGIVAAAATEAQQRKGASASELGRRAV